jgi:hypothetical protein
MTVQVLTVTLPERLAREAEAKGLLKPEALERLLREELRRRAEQLFRAADRLAAPDQPAPSEAEFEAEIDAARGQRRANEARGG